MAGSGESSPAERRAPAITLPADADGVLELAARSMFDSFARSAMGMMVVDREHRVVWISEGYKRFLPALGFTGATQDLPLYTVGGSTLMVFSLGAPPRE